jgi:hypothetical protein
MYRQNLFTYAYVYDGGLGGRGMEEGAQINLRGKREVIHPALAAPAPAEPFSNILKLLSSMHLFDGINSVE